MEEDSVTHEMRETYMGDLIDLIKDFSDLNYQQRAWVENSIPDILDSWEESLCLFFDSCAIDYFLKENDPRYGITPTQMEALWQFRNIMRDYSDNTPQYMDPRKVLADPDWHAVTACASETLKAFEGYKVPFDSIEVNRPMPR